MLLLLRVLTIVITCIMAYLSINLIKYGREYRTQLPDLSLARADLSTSLPYWCSFIGFLYLIVLCSSFCCWCTSLSMVSVHHMFLIYTRSSPLDLWTSGDRAFSVCAPKLWNSIPFSIRKSSSVTILKRNTKTFLFSKFVTSNSLLFN